jgi:hypothetical protein
MLLIGGNMDKQIECYKCGCYLGIIRDALLYTDMYFICGTCARPKRKEEYDMPDFFKDIFGSQFK